MSPRRVLRKKRAHCIEAALFAAAVLWFHKQPPLLLDLQTVKEDFDHVTCLFKQGKYWGALSKSNHNILRYREPVYLSVRELAMSYFHEYYLGNGKKSLRAYSAPFDLSRLGSGWITDEDDLWDVAYKLDKAKHYKILSASQINKLRPASKIEIQTMLVEECKSNGKSYI